MEKARGAVQTTHENRACREISSPGAKPADSHHTIDTLRYLEELEKAGIEPKQARMFATALDKALRTRSPEMTSINTLAFREELEHGGVKSEPARLITKAFEKALHPLFAAARDHASSSGRFVDLVPRGSGNEAPLRP